MSDLKIFAYYLPQFHPVEQNNKWWGDGFTEWTNVALSRPLFDDHYQPQIPGKLGFYDLRLQQTVIDQAKLAKDHGITAFCYWHYWLGDNTLLLNKPAENLIQYDEPDFPFFFGWANHSWKGVFFGAQERTLVEQKYGDRDDIKKHFQYLKNFFNDSRYYKIDGMPVMQIFDPKAIPNCRSHLQYLNQLSIENGFNGIYFIGENIDCDKREKYGLNSVTYSRHRAISGSKNSIRNNLKVYDYEEASKFFIKNLPIPDEEYPSIVPNWDTTPRLKNNATILHNSTPEKFKNSCSQIFNAVKHKPRKHQIVFLKSWNEWAEGNYIEPDRKWGTSYLEALKESINEFKNKK